MQRWRRRRHLLQGGRLGIPISQATILCTVLQRWWHHHLFPGSGVGIPTSFLIYPTSFCCAEVGVASRSLSKNWSRHSHLTTPLHNTMHSLIMVEVGSSSLSSGSGIPVSPLTCFAILAVAMQRWRWHRHLFQGGGLGIPISLHYTMHTVTKLEVASPSLSRRCAGHPHLTAILCTGLWILLSA